VKNRKVIYTIITLLFAVGFYIYDTYSPINSNPKNESNVEVTSKNTNLLPTSTTDQIVHHTHYSLSYHETYEQAEWVAYELTKKQLANANFKRPYFVQDPKVHSKSAHFKNYKNSGYTKGHLCPAGDMQFSLEAFNDTFLTSNISPQSYEFNSGVWNRLEQKVRYWAEKYTKLYVITGGILSDDLKTIGYEQVAVPNYFYKIVLDNHSTKIKAIAFLIPHENSDKALYKFVTSIDQIESLTGIDFFASLPDAIENSIEQSSSYINWSFN
jgi:endonuclease G